MANPAFSKIFNDKEVVFAVLTGDGLEGENGSQYTLAFKLSPKEKKALVKEVLTFFKENNPGDTSKPTRDPEDWFTKDEESDDYIFWTNAPIDADVKPGRRIKRKRSPGTTFTLEHFETLGAGSIVDVKVRFYIYNTKNNRGNYTNRYGINRALSEVTLKEWVEFTGGDDGVHTDGEELGNDGVDTATDDKFADLVEEILDAIEDEDKDEAKTLLKKLPKDHPAHKQLKKKVKAL